VTHCSELDATATRNVIDDFTVLLFSVYNFRNAADFRLLQVSRLRLPARVRACVCVCVFVCVCVCVCVCMCGSHELLSPRSMRYQHCLTISDGVVMQSTDLPAGDVPGARA